jgi:hypothetical protein
MILTLLLVQHVAGHVDVDGMDASVAPADDIPAFTNGACSLNMSMDEPSFHASTFAKNRARFLEHDVAREVFAAVVGKARGAGLMSPEHFSVDGSLIEAWASLKSFRPKDEKRAEQDPPEDPAGMLTHAGARRRRHSGP